MDQLRAMRVFTTVAEAGSFAAAARALDLTPPVVTRVVAELEEHLGARLMHRTTRRLTLTEVGADYLERARQILADVDEAAAAAARATTEPRGHLRVLLPPALAVHQLAKHLPQFHQRYPQVTVELDSPGPVATVDEAYDLTLWPRASRWTATSSRAAWHAPRSSSARRRTTWTAAAGPSTPASWSATTRCCRRSASCSAASSSSADAWAPAGPRPARPSPPCRTARC